MLKSVHLFGCSSGFVSNLLKPNSIVGFSLTSISSKRLSASSSLSCSSSILSCSSSASLFLAPRTGSFKAFCGSTCSEANQEGTSSSPLSMSESPPPSSSTVVHSSVSHSFYWLVFFKNFFIDLVSHSFDWSESISLMLPVFFHLGWLWLLLLYLGESGVLPYYISALHNVRNR